MSILVVGSMNMDLVVNTERYPQKGETVSGRDFNQIPGGKGANQATAVAKLGGEVNFISACGQDVYGEELLQNLKKNGVNIDNVVKLNKNTGVAIITIERDGDNRIIIVPGANGFLTPEIIKKAENILKKANYVLLQLEIPLETVCYTIDMAKKYGVKVILDPAPVQEIPESVYRNIDYLLPNEVEMNSLLKNGRGEGIEYFLDLDVRKVILTEGEKGVTLYTKEHKKSFKAEKVKVVDTTAAGDAFAGGFAYGLDEGWTEEEAIKFANKVAGFAVSKLGAQTSLPTLSNLK